MAFDWSQITGNRNLMRFGGDALADLGYGLANSTNLGNAFGVAATRGAQMQPQRSLWAQQEEEEAEAQEVKNRTAEYLRSQGAEDLAAAVEGGMMDGGTAFSTWYQQANAQPDLTADMQNYQFAQANPGFAEFMNNGSGQANVSLTPQWGQDADGNWVMLQTSSNGQLVQSQIPDGVTLADPRTVASERAFGSKYGGAQGEAAVAAPSDIATGEMALDLIEQIRTSPELPYATGTVAGLGGNSIPGTGRYGFQNLVDQAKSGAFLSAIQEMRGMGALSNAEGGAATQAITRMNTALSEADFKKALDDYEAIVRKGMERSRSRLQGGGASSGGVYVYNPATGRLEQQ